MGSLAVEGLERLSLPLEDPSKVQAQTGYLWSPSAPWWLVPSSIHRPIGASHQGPLKPGQGPDFWEEGNTASGDLHVTYEQRILQ